MTDDEEREEAREEAEAAAERAEHYISAHTEYETRQERTSSGVEKYRVPVSKPEPSQTAGYVCEAFPGSDYRVESDWYEAEPLHGPRTSFEVEYAVVEINEQYNVRVEYDEATVIEAQPRTSAGGGRE